MARRNQHSREELQALAVHAVRELVEEQGLAKLSVRKVAERIRYTPGMLYHVFANLDDLILHANAATLDALLAEVETVNTGSPQQALHHMASAYLALAREQTALWQMVFMHRMQAADGSAGGGRVRQRHPPGRTHFVEQCPRHCGTGGGKQTGCGRRCG